MKYIKYLVSVLLFGATLVSCGPSEGGTVGQTTVQFKEEVLKAGFGADYIYVPISIFGANADAMNTADVNVTVKVDETYTGSGEGVYVAKEDLTGKPEDGGDIRVTSYDLVFRNNYEIADENKNKPFTKDIKVEIMLLNKDPEIMEFKLVLESSNTTIGAVKECVVRLEKGATDRLCGAYSVKGHGNCPFDAADSDGAFDVNISWNIDYNCFDIENFAGFTYAPISAYWDAETEEMYMLPYEPLLWYDPDAMQMCYSMFFAIDGGNLVLPSEKRIVLEYNIEKGTIKLPSNYAFGVLVFSCDEAYNPGQLIGRFTACEMGYTFTKKK